MLNSTESDSARDGVDPRPDGRCHGGRRRRRGWRRRRWRGRLRRWRGRCRRHHRQQRRDERHRPRQRLGERRHGHRLDGDGRHHGHRHGQHRRHRQRQQQCRRPGHQQLQAQQPHHGHHHRYAELPDHGKLQQQPELAAGRVRSRNVVGQRDEWLGRWCQWDWHRNPRQVGGGSAATRLPTAATERGAGGVPLAPPAAPIGKKVGCVALGGAPQGAECSGPVYMAPNWLHRSFRGPNKRGYSLILSSQV